MMVKFINSVMIRLVISAYHPSPLSLLFFLLSNHNNKKQIYRTEHKK
jgi:uracil DNA glycosylase